ncbi:HTTM domain-containing protein [soil metagenome]
MSASGRLRGAFNTLVARLFAPVDISSVVMFRVAFGLVMVWEVYRYFNYGWVASKYIQPNFHFSYLGFEWVKPWPGNWMYVHFYALALLALFIAVGFFYRISAALFSLLFVILFLMEKGVYLNHLYLVALVSFIMIFVPANRAYSMDSLRRPAMRSDTIPAWSLYLLASQFAIVYIYGGFAKLNPDWLRGEPMRTWMSRQPDFPIIGRWFTDEWMVYAMSYGGLLLDLLIVPLILWYRTRWFAVIAAVLFHRFNAEMFSIGIFPTFATAAIILFLPPDLPRRVATFVRSLVMPEKHASPSQTVKPGTTADHALPFTQRPLVQRLTVVFVVAYLGIQLLAPLRHHLYPGDPAWNEQGDRFSWRMMLNTKSGDIAFYVTHPASGETWTVSPYDYLTRQQAGDVEVQPDMAVEFSHYLSDLWQRSGYDDVEVRARAFVSLNSRAPQMLIDPTVDLASVKLSVMPHEWVTSLDEEQRLAETFELEELLNELGEPQE